MHLLPRLYDWLAVSDTLQPSDLIFVLAGREYRKDFGLRMFAEGWSSTLLLSVGRFEIRHFAEHRLQVPIDLVALASTIPAARRHFFVTVGQDEVQAELISCERLGTWREIRALAKWLKRQQRIQTLTIISSGFHLKRVRWCCKNLLPRGITPRYVAAPSEFTGFSRSQWWRNALSRRLVLLELVKLVLYPLLVDAWESA